MNFIKIEGRIVNVDLLMSAVLDEPTNTLVLQMTESQLTFPLNDTTKAAYDWLVGQCAASFEAGETNGETTDSHGLSQAEWRFLKRINHHEQRTDLPGMAIDDDDTEITIELEKYGYIRTDVHNAWLTEFGRGLLEEHLHDGESTDAG